MIVNRVITLNPVEPSPLSLRAPMGMETRLDVRYVDVFGHPYQEDPAAQLQLTARSDNVTNYYTLASTDMVNGRARATIPAGDLSDPNGYRARVTGTWRSEPALLAIGTVMPIAAAGPEAAPVDVVDQIPLAFDRDEDVSLDITLWADDGKSAPYDLSATGTVVTAQIITARNGTLLVPFGVAVTGVNTVQLSLTAMQVNVLPDACWWSLQVAAGGGLQTLCEGTVTVTGVVKPPFTDVIANYNYTKQDALTVPTAGIVIHANYALDVIRMHQFDSDGTDRSVTLDQLRLGDQIVIGVTTWSIQAISKAGLDWYQITIAPNTQAAVSGINPVTFHRP